MPKRQNATVPEWQSLGSLCLLTTWGENCVHLVRERVEFSEGRGLGWDYEWRDAGGDQ